MEPLLTQDLSGEKTLPKTMEVNVIKDFLNNVIHYWYWFILSVVVCVGVTYVYLRWYTIPIYNIESRLLIKQPNTSSGSQQELINQLQGSDNAANVLNEVEVLQTKFLMKRVVHNLQLNVSIFSKGNIKSTELYNNAPFRVHLLNINDSAVTHSWKVTMNAKGNNPVFTGAEGTMELHWGDTVRVKNLTFTVDYNGYPGPGALSFPTGVEYFLLVIRPEDATALQYLGGLKVAPISDGMNIIKMSTADPLPQRGVDVLNNLYDVYVQANVEDQNTIADNTIKFIDDRLAMVSGELTGVEKHIEQFKSTNKLVDLAQQSSMVANNASELQKQMDQLDVQLQIVQAIEGQLNGKDFTIVPASLITQNAAYSTLVERFNSLVLERDNQRATSSDKNPFVLQLNDNIRGVRKDLQTQLGNIKKELLINKADLQSRIDQSASAIKVIPSMQRVFLDISRQQEVKQQLYLFLLQKKEETAISKSGTLSNSRLIDPAHADPAPFSPNRRNIYLSGLMLGLLLPVAVIYLKAFRNTRIRERKDITTQTATPILGEIGHNKSTEALIVTNDARSVIAEQFRAIRTNLKFFLTGKKHHVILITSSMSGEGKSFISLNLASTLAISGKKVVLLELDLRKPRLSSLIGLPNDHGFTNFVVSNVDLKYLPKAIPNRPNLYIINSGPIPPNPAELLLQDKVPILFEYLYANFDYIVIDSPPVGLVTDALLVAGYADTCLYVTRQDYTFKQQISIVDDLFVQGKMKGLAIVINDVDTRKGYGYGYGYGYGPGAYYAETPGGDKGWRKRFKKKQES
jgi:tyrosine-protein kinase Etk/Wzc